MDLTKIYRYALQREREGRDFFASHAERAAHAAAAGVFRRLVDEEEKHIAYVQSLLNALEEEAGPAAPAPMAEGEGLFMRRADIEMLDQTMIESMVPDVTALRTAYLIEKDFAEFYEMAAGKAEGEAKQALLRLAQWERGHEQLFKTLHDKVYEGYMNMPWGG
jgi:rubrerythrin